MRRFLQGLAGFLLGILAGAVVTMAIVVFRAQLMEVFLHSAGELLGWVVIPGLLLPFLGAWAAVSSRVPCFWGGVAASALGMAVGIGAGALFGDVGSDASAGPWAGGIVGAAVGMLIGLALGLYLGTRDSPRASSRVTAAGTAVAAGATLVLLLGGGFAGERPPALPGEAPPEPAPEDVESVVLLVGDAGGDPIYRYPVLERAERDVERWASVLPRDSSVTVVFLGDIVYPEGVHSPAAEMRRQDSLTVLAQADVVGGRAAVDRKARGIFLPGNHDWGQEEDWEGARRLQELNDILSSLEAERDLTLRLSPEPGSGGPRVVDVGAHLRLVLLDTAWWLLEGERARKDEVIQGVDEAIRTAGDRKVVLGAHHPFASGGPHGESLDFQRTFGIGFLLNRSGAMLQDLDSRPYADLRRRLLQVFREREPPALFAGGHEHSVQVFEGTRPEQPETSLVVGSASKLTGVEGADGMQLGLSAPGYAKLFVLEDGSARLFVEATDPEFIRCPRQGTDQAAEHRGPVGEACVSEALEAFRIVWGGSVGEERAGRTPGKGSAE